MRRLLTLSVLLVSILVQTSHAQQSVETLQGVVTRPFKIYMVTWRGHTAVEDGFIAYLQERGIPHEIIFRNLERDRSRIPGFIDEIKEIRPDLVYTWGTSTSTGILGPISTRDPDVHVTDIPAVFTLVAYPKAAGLIEADEAPGGMVTGVRFLAPVEAQMNAIRAYRPFSKLGVIYNPRERNSVLNIEELRNLSQQGDFQLIEKPAPLDENNKPVAASVPSLVRSAKADGAEMLYIGPDSFTAVNADVLTGTAIEVGLPTFAATEFPLLNSRAMSGLISRYYALGKLTGRQAEQILVGQTPPGELPVATLSRFSYIVNMPVVLELGFYPPMSILQFADILE